MQERLQKLIAAAGLASRRRAEEWIVAGRVMVNGASVSLGDKADPETDLIEVDGQPLPKAVKTICLMLNKPTGYVTTTSDPEGRQTVLDLLPADVGRVYPIGRLDLNTEGLLLLTNDGALAQHLAHPRHKVEKTYLARVKGRVDASLCRRLEKGVVLDDGLTAPAKVHSRPSRSSHSWLEITIHEGRNRQVRRMCETVGLMVSRLKRTRLGFLELGELQTGTTRQLTADEIKRLKSL